MEIVPNSALKIKYSFAAVFNFKSKLSQIIPYN